MLRQLFFLQVIYQLIRAPSSPMIFFSSCDVCRKFSRIYAFLSANPKRTYQQRVKEQVLLKNPLWKIGKPASHLVKE